MPATCPEDAALYIIPGLSRYSITNTDTLALVGLAVLRTGIDPSDEQKPQSPSTERTVACHSGTNAKVFSSVTLVPCPRLVPTLRLSKPSDHAYPTPTFSRSSDVRLTLPRYDAGQLIPAL